MSNYVKKPSLGRIVRFNDYELAIIVKVNRDRRNNGTVNIYLLNTGRIIEDIFPKNLVDCKYENG